MNSVCNKELLQTQKRDPNEKATATEAAEIFGTNRTFENTNSPYFSLRIPYTLDRIHLHSSA